MTSPAPALISLHGASVRFGERTALQGIDLALLKGERLALIGSNGSGKTTLLRLLHGLLPTSAGRREVQGAAPGGPPPRMAMLFQKPHFFSSTLPSFGQVESGFFWMCIASSTAHAHVPSMPARATWAL